jgi:monooxygenase
VAEQPLLDFTSGYVLRSLDQFPKQGSKEPWRLRQNYVFDIRTIRRGPIDDGAMRFSSGVPRTRPADPIAA